MAVTMVHPFNFSLLVLLVMCIVLHGIEKTSVGGSNSCEVTKSTVQVVDGCPDSEEKWREAAARKNCSAYANQCSEPSKLVYHCVINEYVTETLEVCAYSRYIFSGKCTGYSISGNVIQQNSRTNCAVFKYNSCPKYYNSDEAYKYPDCYKLTKKSTTVYPTFMTDPDTFASDFTTTRFNVSSSTPVNMFGKEEHTESNNSTQTIIIVICVVLVLIAVVAVFVYLRIIKRKSQNRNKHEEEETHHLNGTGKNIPI